MSDSRLFAEAGRLIEARAHSLDVPCAQAQTLLVATYEMAAKDRLELHEDPHTKPNCHEI
jgi:hypothetical protein